MLFQNVSGSRFDVVIVGDSLAALAAEAMLSVHAPNALVTRLPPAEPTAATDMTVLVWPSAARLLDKLATKETPAPTLQGLTRTSYETAGGESIGELDFSNTKAALGSTMEISRFLVDVTRPKAGHPGGPWHATTTTMDDRDSIILQDGPHAAPTRTIRTRLLVGATGTKGLIRERFTRGKSTAGHAGNFHAFDIKLQTMHASGLPVGAMHVALAPGIRAVFLRRSAESVCFWLHAKGHPQPEHRVEWVRNLLADFSPLVRDLVLQHDLTYLFSAPSEWATWDVPQAMNRIVLVGDEGHAMPPDLGLGVTLALEDAYVLADEVRKSVHQAPVRFTERRSARVDLGRDISVMASRALSSCDPTFHRFAVESLAASLRAFGADAIDAMANADCG